MQERLDLAFRALWRDKCGEGTPNILGAKALLREAFDAGAKAMENIANTYSQYVMEFMSEQGPCVLTGNSPVCLGEWLDSEESANALEHKDELPPTALIEEYEKPWANETKLDCDISMADVIAAFQLGFWEGPGDVGMTYNNDTEDPRSVAYDMGRNAWRTLFEREDEEEG